MTTGMKTLVIAGATFGLLSGARPVLAQEEAQMNYRCENAMAQADAGELKCLDRCQRKAEKRSDNVQAQFFAVCADDCHTRCDEKKRRAENGPKCAAASSKTDPRRCAAKHLGALAQLNHCLSSCTTTARTDDDQATVVSPEELACEQHCDERYTTARDRIDKSDACALGGAPVCVYQ